MTERWLAPVTRPGGPGMLPPRRFCDTTSVMTDTLDLAAVPDAGPDPDLTARMLEMGRRARAASQVIGTLPADRRTAALAAMARRLRAVERDLLDANAEDVARGKENGLDAAMLDRLALDPKRVEAIASGLEAVAALPDPVGRELARWRQPNGLEIARVACPLGVIGIIFESRPNVTADAGALCVRSGNAAILRCGSESIGSSSVIVEAMRAALLEEGLPVDAVQLVSTRDRAAVGHMLSGLDGQVDVIVPRGGKSLVARVQEEARVPVIGHLEGLCHVYMHAGADRDMAREIILNAKLRRTGVCGAAETLLIDQSIAAERLPGLVKALADAGCEVRGDALAQALVPGIVPATAADWTTEYLAPILAVRVVDGLEAALAHIAAYGSGHTDSIVTEDAGAAARFLNEVDSAIVMHNASTQFADGAEFGMGAEIGIATGRIHARGPVGADQLTIFKYVVRGTGQTRPG